MTMPCTPMYMKDGELVNAQAVSVMVEDAYGLPNIAFLPPCSIAYTAGGGSKWQLNASGQWIDCSNGGNTAESAIVGLGLAGMMTI